MDDLGGTSLALCHVDEEMASCLVGDGKAEFQVGEVGAYDAL